MRYCFFLFSVIISFGWSSYSNAQISIEKDYFMFPINPGHTNYLSGSMGELRSNHFHAGIDIKTGGKIGLPVYCSADGYVSRIRVSTFGYGRVIYITHPNGLTTVYAHLDELNTALASWTLKKQYELESFEIDEYLGETELLVKKGEVVAYSGNTGGSGGPHLHYEVRDVRENVWNPLLFGFDEVRDNLSPIIQLLAIRTFNIGSFVDNEFGRMDYIPRKSGPNYTLADPIKAVGEIGIELKAYDRMNDTHNRYGISCIELKVNDKEIFYHNLNTFSFEDGKKINAHIDYETYIARNQRFEKCYVSDGNTLASYKDLKQNGHLKIEAGKSYKIDITVYDIYGNNSSLNFVIEGTNPEYTFTSKDKSRGGYRIFENTLKIKGDSKNETLASFYRNNKITFVAPTYVINGYPVYLYDLRKNLPDSVRIDQYSEHFDFLLALKPGQKTNIKYDNFNIQFSDSALIDTLYLQLNCIKDPSGQHCLNIHDPTYPVFGKIDVAYIPKEGESIHPNSYLSLNGRKYEESQISNEGLTAKTKYLGNFVIVNDSIPPVVKYYTHSAKTIKFNIFDSGSGIDSMRATLNGNFILMHYEHKKRSIWSENLDPKELLKGDFKLEVFDNAGNKTVFEKKL